MALEDVVATHFLISLDHSVAVVTVMLKTIIIMLMPIAYWELLVSPETEVLDVA